jgi:phage portal protein BeeE
LLALQNKSNNYFDILIIFEKKCSMIRFGNISDWVQNMFTFGKRSYFINRSYIFGQKGEVWIPVNQPYALYNEIPQLKTVVDKKAKLFSNMELILVNKETKEPVEDFDLQKLLAKPNVLQSFNNFLEEYKIQEQVYGNQFMYKNQPSSLQKYPVALWNISPRYLAPYFSGKVFNQVDLKEIFPYYVYNQNGNTAKYESEYVMYSKINDLDNPVIGCSPIVSLQMPLSNIKGSYSYRNVILTEKGAIGILSNKSKDGMGVVPLSPKEKEELERQYTNEYGAGAGQRRVHVTNSSLEWSPMTYPTKDLMLFEEVDADMLTIIDLYGLNVNIFSNKNSTYENVKNGIKLAYQDTIQPEADKFAQALTIFLNIDKKNELIASYQHITILQEDRLSKTQTLESKIRALTQVSQLGLIDGAFLKDIIETELKLNNND